MNKNLLFLIPVFILLGVVFTMTKNNEARTRLNNDFMLVQAGNSMKSGSENISLIYQGMCPRLPCPQFMLKADYVITGKKAFAQSLSEISSCVETKKALNDYQRFLREKQMTFKNMAQSRDDSLIKKEINELKEHDLKIAKILTTPCQMAST